MSRCGTCGSEIKWARTPKGKAIPLDPTPVVGGNIIEVPGNHDDVDFLSREQVDALRESGGLAFQSHFVSCPDAVSHRKR